MVWEAHGEHCNMHDRNKQQLSRDTQRQHQIPARIPGCPLSLLGFASCAWQREMRSCWRTRHSTSKTLISLGMDEKLCYLCISDDTQGIVIIRDYFRICAPPSKLLYGQTAALLELEGLENQTLICLLEQFWEKAQRLSRQYFVFTKVQFRGYASHFYTHGVTETHSSCPQVTAGQSKSQL